MNFSEKNVVKRSKKLRSRWPARGRRAQVFLLRFGFFLLVCGAIYSAYLGFRYMKELIGEVPNTDAVDLIHDGYTTSILDDSGEAVRVLESSDANRHYVMLDDIPINLQNAFIAIEDEHFRSHDGIEPVTVLKSSISRIANSGSSSSDHLTITQQLLKNQLLSDGGEEENDLLSGFRRKFKELYMALRMENRYNKDEILEFYLNTISLGQNTTGVESASLRYFNKHASELSLPECATLAGIAKNPSAYNPITHSSRNRTRELAVLTAMQDQGFITSDQYELAIQDDVQARIQRYNEEFTKDQKPSSYFTDALLQSVIEDMKSELGYSETQAANALYTGGLKIQTTLDSDMQKICEKELDNPNNYPKNISYQLEYQLTIKHPNGSAESFSFSDIKKWYSDRGEPIKSFFSTEKAARKVIAPFKKSMVRESDEIIAESINTIIEPQASFVIIDQTNGEIKALVGGRGAKLEGVSGGRATDSNKQPGSTFSILSTYLPALDTAGMTLATVKDDTEYYYPGTDELVKNQYGDTYRGLTTNRDAIINSTNVVAVKTLDQVTPRVSYDYLRNLGFSTLVDGYSDDAGRSVTDIALPLALGNLTKGVNNLELTGAFATIAAGGVYNKPHLYTKVLDHDGNVLIDHSSNQSKRVMKDTTAWLLTDAMREEVKTMNAGHITFKKSEMAIAGQSGSSENSNDLWFVGYTPYLTAGIWCGYDENKSQKDIEYHKDIWRRIMEKVSTDYDVKDSFGKNDGLTGVKICTKCGKLAIDGLCEEATGGSCSRIEYFTKDTLPTDSCDCHVRCRICKASGLLAGDGCPESDVYDVIYLQKKDEVYGEGKTMDSNLIMPKYLIDSICDVHNN